MSSFYPLFYPLFLTQKTVFHILLYHKGSSYQIHGKPFLIDEWIRARDAPTVQKYLGSLLAKWGVACSDGQYAII
jgi:hypothetical protein